MVKKQAKKTPESAPAKSGKTASRPKTVAIDVYKAWCKGCGICVAFCPKEVLAQDEDGHAYPKNLDACIACLQCELRCPDFAITVITEERLKGNKEVSNG
ncbi:MAG: 4Fe-4S dicluster domain-containing protein [Nitrospiraceae bacterium]|nr:4Fe-4S dicluster domain-containing protein [Nitrospiraceae bacterium]